MSLFPFKLKLQEESVKAHRGGLGLLAEKFLKGLPWLHIDTSILLQSLPVKPGGFLDVDDLDGMAEPHPGVDLGQADQALQLAGVGGDLSYLHVVLDEDLPRPV